MSLGRSKKEQRNLWLSFDQIPKSQGHAFYERLQKLLRKADFDAFPMAATLDDAQAKLETVKECDRPGRANFFDLVADKG